MLKCSDCKHAKIPGQTCEHDEDPQIESLLESFGVMASGFCVEFAYKESEDDENSRP